MILARMQIGGLCHKIRSLRQYLKPASVILLGLYARADALDLNLSEIGRWPPNPLGPASQVITTGGKAFVVVAGQNLVIFDLTDPRLLPSSFQGAPWPVKSLNLSSNYLFLAGGDLEKGGEVFVLDLKELNSPSALTNYAFALPALAVALSGDTLFVATAGANGASIEILNVSDPVAPASRGAIRGISAEALAISGSTLVAIGNGKLHFFNIADLANVHGISTVETPQGANSIFSAGSELYLAAGFDGLQILDISDPGRPEMVGSYDTWVLTEDIIAAGMNAFALGTDYSAERGDLVRLEVLDVANPKSPFAVGGLRIPGRFRQGHYLFNDVLVLSCYSWDELRQVTNSLVVVDVKNRTRPVIRSRLDTKGPATVAAGVDYVVMVDPGANGAQGSLKTLDLNSAENPKVLGNLFFPTNATPSAIAVSGRYAYVVLSNPVTLESPTRAEIIDLADPTAPKFSGSSIPAGSSLNVSSGRLLTFVEGAAPDDKGLIAYDLADAVHPQRIQRYDFHRVSAFTVSADTAYAFQGGGHTPELGAFDISNPNRPRVLGRFAFGSGGSEFPRGICVQGRYAYIADEEGIRVIDLTRPANPQRQLVYGSAARTLSVSNQTAYLAKPDGLEIVDVRNVEEPQLLGTYRPPSENRPGLTSGYQYIAIRYPFAYLVNEAGFILGAE